MLRSPNRIGFSVLIVALILTVSAVEVIAQEGDTTVEENKQFIRDYLDALSGNDKPPELVDQYVADSDQELKDHIAFFEAAFPQYELVAEDMVAEGDKVAVRAVMRGVHKGEFMGLPPTDIAVEVSGMLIYRIEDNRIVKHWMRFDELGLMTQLGMLPSPETSGGQVAIETELRSLMDQFWAAASETDFDQIYAMVDDRHHLSVIDNGIFYPTPDESRVYFRTGTGRQTITIDEVRIAALTPTTAAVVVSGEFTLFPNDSDDTFQTAFAMTLIWIKTDDQWRLAHMHQSFPLSPLS